MTDRTDRAARPEDIDEICLSLPEVELGVSWGDRPTYKVPRGPKGRGFLLFRMPHPTATDPETGEMYDDVVVITVADEAAKEALVADPGTPFFTIPHFRRTNAVLLRQSQVGELDLGELREVIAEAWATRAPKRLLKEYRDRG
ncbi:MmcQ/YjbR family DNA-binding protein [Nocardioides sp. 616]|uniref:MmcQ/YjbR family DNA-binding protein n=1 Tax=Nocardioides sp. 616 TaxID=2268090 RepID=UPI000CE3DA7F|nr:MmcQ/YjbR family DNA-binding protein [Nocardioides sp. 616]